MEKYTSFFGSSALAFSPVVATVLGLFFLKRQQRLRLAPHHVSVSKLNIFPIKSCGGIEVSRARVDRLGFAGDRRWIVIDAKDTFVTQRQISRMVTIRASYVELDGKALAPPGVPVDLDRDMQGLALKLEAEGMEPLLIPVEFESEIAPPFTIKVWDSEVKVRAASLAADAWLSNYLQKPGLRLVSILPMDKHTREIDPAYNPLFGSVIQSALSDDFPFLLASDSSLVDLNRRLPAGEEEIEMLRFRPNISVGGRDLVPWAEDHWTRITIHAKKDLDIFVPKACVRCSMPNVNPTRGEMPAKLFVTKLLTTFREKAPGMLIFGQNLVHTPASIGSAISVGDKVTITGYVTKPKFP